MKDFFEKIKELKETKYGKAILFFGFYLIFFLIVIIGLKFGSKNPLSSYDEYEKGNAFYKFEIDKLVEKNFNFQYIVTIDGINNEYLGKLNDKKEIFNYNNIQYYRNGDSFYINNGTWTSSDNPYLFRDFIDIENMITILSLASYKSNTTYDNGTLSYNFLISTNTINQTFYNINSDFLEEPNEIEIITDSDKVVNEINFKLDNYCKLNNLCQNSLTIKLKYSNFGEVEEIVEPI